MSTSAISNKGILRVPPGPYGNPIFGNVQQVRRDPLQLYLDARRKYGDVVRFRSIYPFCWYLASHPDQVEYILHGNQQNYVKSDHFLKETEGLLGQGLFTSQGEFWRRQRRLAQPAFHRQRLASIAEVMVEASRTMADRWNKVAESGRPFDAASEMMKLTLKIAGLALFSTETSQHAETVALSLTTALEYLNYRLTHPMALSQKIPLPRNIRYFRALANLDKVVGHIISGRRASGEDRGDLLSMLLLARDEETGIGMTDRQLRDEVMTIYLAGHETTAVALSWTWYLLALHPEIERRLHEEIDGALDGSPPTFDALALLPYTKMVIEESMRLYPPAWATVRQSLRDDVIGGYDIPAKSSVVISQYVTHRHPDFWENPEVFDPERFRPELTASRPRSAYFPFGGGPRICIGNNFAMMEAQLALTVLAQRYRLKLVPDHLVEPNPKFTLRPRYGVRVIAEKRKKI